MSEFGKTLKQNLKRDWFILTSLVAKDFKLKYRRSILGVLWSVLNPLLMMIVLAAVFSFVFRGDASTQPFPVYLILGTILFNLMAVSTTAGASSIIDSAGLIKKIRVNKLVFPIEKVIFELVNFALSLIAAIIVLVIFRVIPTLDILYLPLLLFYVVLFSIGLSLLLAALAVFFRDIIYLWGVVITAWTYTTPLFYSISLLPPEMLSIMRFNPMYHFVSYFRAIVMSGVPSSLNNTLASLAQLEPIAHAWQAPGLQENLICFGFALITFAAGYLVFNRTQRKFILYV